MFKRIVEIKKNPNRVIATIRRWKDKIKILILSNMVLAVAFLKNIVAADEKNIEYISCPQSKSASRITVNCMGYVEEVCDYSEYQTCLNSISGLLKKADLSLISMQYTDKESSEDTKGFFEKYGIYSEESISMLKFLNILREKLQQFIMIEQKQRPKKLA